ncbi:hypothetical protein HYX07_00410 [Candidatus Woesearchaeota archaeon]|nr:hypothetical protein [Candidatus Woesearchaeota archaeon]
MKIDILNFKSKKTKWMVYSIIVILVIFIIGKFAMEIIAIISGIIVLIFLFFLFKLFGSIGKLEPKELKFHSLEEKAAYHRKIGEMRAIKDYKETEKRKKETTDAIFNFLGGYEKKKRKY